MAVLHGSACDLVKLTWGYSTQDMSWLHFPLEYHPATSSRTIYIAINIYAMSLSTVCICYHFMHSVWPIGGDCFNEKNRFYNCFLVS